jgi:hypothetical protein
MKRVAHSSRIRIGISGAWVDDDETQHLNCLPEAHLAGEHATTHSMCVSATTLACIGPRDGDLLVAVEGARECIVIGRGCRRRRRVRAQVRRDGREKVAHFLTRRRGDVRGDVHAKFCRTK